MKQIYLIGSLVLVCCVSAGLWFSTQFEVAPLTTHTQSEESPQEESSATSSPPEEETLTRENIESDTLSEESPAAATPEIPAGIHIMANGSVMAGDGTVLADAVVLQNGNVQLGNGVVVKPKADLRTQASVSESTHHTFEVSGYDFAYDIKQIKVQKGDTVTINFTSTDGFHDWVVDAFDAATERVNEGDSTSVTFVADKQGTFQYYCSVMSHRAKGMVGYLVVE